MKQIITIIVSLFFVHSMFGQLVTPFTIRYQTQQKGGITFISNTAVTCDGGTGCFSGQGEVPPGGSTTNDGLIAAFVDIDTDTNTFMSSSDSLVLPSCSEITWAGLYWGAHNQIGDPTYANRDEVMLSANNGAYTTLVADYLEDNVAGFNSYHCFKDVTAFVQMNGLNVRYTLANVAARTGGGNQFGGWTLVVVYKNESMPLRNLTVFNGLSNVSIANPVTDIPISGFMTPVAGPVNFDLGIVSYDGDRASTGGDQLQLNGNGSFVNIFDAVNPASDVFNSTISTNGIVTPYRNPVYNNTLGYDADIFQPNNTGFAYLGNADTSAILRQISGGESFLTQVVTSSFDVYEPDLRVVVKVQDLNGGAAMPGDTLEYTISAKNIGLDPSVNTYITDTLEKNVSYVPNSINITWGPNPGMKTDAFNDDQAEYDLALNSVIVRIGSGADDSLGGLVLNSPTGLDSTQFKFRVVTTSDCVNLSCDNSIDNTGNIFGTGNLSDNTYMTESTPGTTDSSGCQVTGPTTLVVDNSGCTFPSDTSMSTCEHMPFTLAYDLPGYTYFDDSYNVVMNADTSGTFYAVHMAYAGCTDTVTIILTSLVDCDLDNDSLINVFDADDDNDGLPDSVETSADLDLDGVINSEDLDSDNDGIPDRIEAAGLDTNGDGRIDAFVDMNNDGMDDSTAINPLLNADLDGDGVNNIWDLDSDDDGIADVIEARGFDGDLNGQIGIGFGTGIADGDGDGFADTVDTDDGGIMLTLNNTDSLTGADYADIDSDNDGIVDNIEGQSTTGYFAPSNLDSDGDGMDNAYDAISGFGAAGILIVNTEGTGDPDFCDLDTDDDSEMDSVEAWDTDNNGSPNTIASGLDNDADGLDNAFDVNDAAWNPTNGQTPTSFPNLDNTSTTERDWREFLDSDADGVTDVLDLDNDNDGIPDATESFIAPNGPDTDGDGYNDEYDLDSDNDGIADIVEAGGADIDGNGEIDAFTDANNNGLEDSYEITPLPCGNMDGDPQWDGADLDSDNDGITDTREAGGADPDNNGQIGVGSGTSIPDTDQDGFSNVTDTDNGGTMLARPNTDNIGNRDYLELDSDHDGIADNIEAQATASYIAPSLNDADADGIMDSYDNISGFGGLGIIPVNTDGSDFPDYRDPDSDNDSYSDAIEGWDTDNNGSANTSPSGTDNDADGLDNAYDNDDATWVVNNGQTPASFPNLDIVSTPERDWREAGIIVSVDTDGDGVLDITDIDDDNDGLLDATELATAQNGGDTDNDLIDDNLDLDSDADGIWDVIEGGGVDGDDDGVIGTGAIVDTDGDGWSNITDSDNGGTALPNPDTDGDGMPNFQDVDSDGDTVLDSIENDPFSTGNGPVDTDGDGTENYIDTNDDNDGKLTTDEADEDGDGFLDDCDDDGIPDYLDPDGCNLSIPEGFSPNGDGINDYFVIQGLNMYSNTKLSIFNRWGNLVYETNNYNNTWNGEVTEGATLGGDDLPVGTYFYVLDLGNGNDLHSGYIYLNR